MYFGSVKFFKHVIVIVTILLIITPCVFCFTLSSKVNDLTKENEKLKDEIGEYQLAGHQTRYEADELFGLYKERAVPAVGLVYGLIRPDNGFSVVGNEARGEACSREESGTQVRDETCGEGEENREIIRGVYSVPYTQSVRRRRLPRIRPERTPG